MPSRSNTIKTAAALFVSVIIGVAALQLTRRTRAEKPPLMLSSFLSKGEVNRTLKVSIEFDTVKTDEEATSLAAHLSVPFNFNQEVKYRWILGEGVKLIEGNLEGSQMGFVANEDRIVKIKVSGFSKQQNHQVKFEAIGAVAGRYIMGESLVASDLEHTFENTVQNVERIKASQ